MSDQTSSCVFYGWKLWQEWWFIPFRFFWFLISFSQVLPCVDWLCAPKNLTWKFDECRVFIDRFSLSTIYLVHCVYSLFMYIWYESHRSNFGQRFLENTQKMVSQFPRFGFKHESARTPALCVHLHDNTLFENLFFLENWRWALYKFWSDTSFFTVT